jgi:probable phosphoglycerate mutase
MLELASGITLYFARHGETEANVEHRFQGLARDTPLTKLGLRQTADIAAILTRTVGPKPQLAFVSSPLKRARTTMEMVLDALDLPTDNYTTDARIEEIDLGAWDGLTKEEARALDPALFDERMADRWNVRVPGGGENYADVATRARSWIADIETDTFAVSHGAFTRILRGLFAGLDGAQMAALDEPQGCVFRVRGHDVERLDRA